MREQVGTILTAASRAESSSDISINEDEMKFAGNDDQ